MLATTLAASLALAPPAAAQEAPKGAPSPNEIVAAAPAKDWVAIAPSDLLVMTLAPDRSGNKRQVVIQLMPPPFSQGWIGNIRKLAAAHWWDGLAITRVQDNYVVQWGDPDAEDKAKAKALPPGLEANVEANYSVDTGSDAGSPAAGTLQDTFESVSEQRGRWRDGEDSLPKTGNYADLESFYRGWPFASNEDQPKAWPIHCYGMVGVGRNYSPDTGSGAELYTVIGHAPRHLDRNIALVGRVVEGIEHLSSLPRGTGALGFYEKPEQRVPIQSIRLASELPAAEQPRFEYLSTESDSFARYADARANRRDPFFIVPAGGADICNIPVPVRRAM
jgi:cyclophilin family peptidyl-prolyl cis-trans isomerase